MSIDKVRTNAVAFFTEAIVKWNELIGLFNIINKRSLVPSYIIKQANDILVWFQDNYVGRRKFSSFSIITNLGNGNQITEDPIFNVIYGGANIMNIVNEQERYLQDLNAGCAALRGILHLSKNLKMSPR
ncbi:MAG: hypothetical protein ABSF44_06835 [Candidatus Bathyarchaeia archaeon]|jgi:hypothetical protein